MDLIQPLLEYLQQHLPPDKLAAGLALVPVIVAAVAAARAALRWLVEQLWPDRLAQLDAARKLLPLAVVIICLAAGVAVAWPNWPVGLGVGFVMAASAVGLHSGTKNVKQYWTSSLSAGTQIRLK